MAFDINHKQKKAYVKILVFIVVILGSKEGSKGDRKRVHLNYLGDLFVTEMFIEVNSHKI